MISIIALFVNVLHVSNNMTIARTSIKKTQLYAGQM